MTICSVSRNHNPVVSSFVTYHRVCNEDNTTGDTSGTGTAQLPEDLSSTPVISRIRQFFSVQYFVDHYLSFYTLNFRLAIVLSAILRFTASDYPVNIFKLLFTHITITAYQTIIVILQWFVEWVFNHLYFLSWTLFEFSNAFYPGLSSVKSCFPNFSFSCMTNCVK